MGEKKRGHGPPGPRSPATEQKKFGIRTIKRDIWINSRIRDG